MTRGIDERDNPARIAHMMAAEPQVLAAALGAYNALNANNIPNSHDPGGIADRGEVAPQGPVGDQLMAVQLLGKDAFDGRQHRGLVLGGDEPLRDFLPQRGHFAAGLPDLLC